MSEKYKKYTVVYIWSPGYGGVFTGGLFKDDEFVGTKAFSTLTLSRLGVKVLHGKERTKFLSRKGYVVDPDTKRLRLNKRTRFKID